MIYEEEESGIMTHDSGIKHQENEEEVNVY
jgi:hypothetical protein